MHFDAKNLQVLCLNPLVAIVDDFFDADMAAKIIAKSEAHLERARVVGKTGDVRAVHDGRTNRSAKVDQWSDPDITALVTAVSGLVRLPPENAEPCQLLHYVGEQKFDPHSDAFDGSAGGRQMLARGGQRLFTTICYLNDVDAGGETEFPALKLRIAAKRGRVLIFGNTRLGTAEAHPHSLHAGRAVEADEKYVMSIWWRQLAYHVQRDYDAETGDMQTH